MDPVSALGLAASCVGLVANIASASKGLSDFITQLKEADKSITYLASHLGLIEIVVDELQRWLGANPNLERRSRIQLASAFKSCDVIVSDIEQHLARVRPKPGEKASSLKQKLTLLWNDSVIKEHREALSHCLQAFQILVSLTQL